MAKLRSDDGLKFPYPPMIAERLSNALSFGNTGIIELLPSGDKVKKSPHPQGSSYDKAWQRGQLRREIEVYRRLPASDRLIRMFGYSNEDDGGLILEYMSNGNLRTMIEAKAEITLLQRLRWAVEAAEAVVLLHSHGVIHADIKPENMLLDDRLGLRIIDLSGASIDGKPPLSLESTRFYLPRSMRDKMPCSTTTDIFALGSSIYQIVTRKQPYEDLDDAEVEARFARKEFPPLEGVACEGVIKKCWLCGFESAQAVLEAFKAEMRHYVMETEKAGVAHATSTLS
ncbi:hypothetical protein diail_8796 [Diaporthe ilicicola]|nr:hypothetical protein diail_8796 [Diaporthe ilicicola]